MARSRRGTVRSASKLQEADLLKRCRSLADHPEHAIPECDGSCVFLCPFKRARKHAQKARDALENEGKLKRLAARGPPLGRAYAAALLAGRAEKVSHLANARLPFGTYPYIYRGKAKATYHVGVQHHHDPTLRLLGPREEAVKRRLVVYSVGDGLVCTHHEYRPPEAFVADAVERVALHRRDDALHTCPHPKAVPAVELAWRSGGVTFRVCATCEAERNLAVPILERMAAKDPRDDFDVRVTLPEVAGIDGDTPLPAPLQDAYLRGRLTNRGLLDAAYAARRKDLEGREGFLLVVGDQAYRSAKDAVTALADGEVEETALAAALEGVDHPVVVDRASVPIVLHAVWEETGEDALAAVLGADVAAETYDPELDAGAIKALLQEAAAVTQRRRILAKLPTYGDLPAPAALADAAARAYRTDGPAAAVRVVTDRDVDPDAKGVALAILRALDEDDPHAWRYSQMDREAADVLADEAAGLLTGDVSDYHTNLDQLNRKLGAGEVPPPTGTH